MHRPMPADNPATWRTSARRGSLSIVLWGFGLATTLLLVGLWGRAITYDQPTIETSARSVVDAEIASGRISSWIEEGLASTGEVDPEVAGRVMAELNEHPELEMVATAVVDQFVDALFAPNGEVATVDLTDTLAPLVPLITSTLAERGETVDAESLAAALDEAESINLGTGGTATITSVVTDARSLLSVIVVLSAVALVFTGGSAVALSEDRLGMVRTLATRVVLSAVSFAVLFRIGSWVLDPQGGGSPVAAGGSVLLGSNSHVFLLTGVVSGVIAVVVAAFVMRARGRSIPSSPVSESSDDSSHDTSDDTKELVHV